MQSFIEYLLEQVLSEGTQYIQRTTKGFLKIWNGHSLPQCAKELAIYQFRVLVKALEEGGFKKANDLLDLKHIPEGGNRNIYQVKIGIAGGVDWRALANLKGNEFIWYWIGKREALNGGANSLFKYGRNVEIPTKVRSKQKPLKII